MASTKMTSKVVIVLILSYFSTITYGKCVAKSARGEDFCQVVNENPMKVRSSNQTIPLSMTPGLHFFQQPSDVDNAKCLLSGNMTNSLPNGDLVNNMLPTTFDNIIFHSNGNISTLISSVQHQRKKRLTAPVGNQAKARKHHVVKRKSRHHNHHSIIHHKKHHHRAHGDQKMVKM